MAFMWGQAYDITAVEDAYDRNHAEDRKQLIRDLLDTFIKVNGVDLMWDSWNDDIAWAIIAYVRGYQITNDRKYLDIAIKAWNGTYDRGWDDVGGGGIWEEMDSRFSKCGLSNHPMVMSGVPLYEITGDKSYLTKSEAIYGWARNKLLKPSGQHDDCVAFPKDKPSYVQGSDNAYNTGLMINAANSLYRVTGKRNHYDDALLAANHTTTKHPIMTEDHPENGDFGSEQFTRGLSNFARQNGLWDKFYSWLQANCQAAWDTRRKDYNISWNKWNQQTPDTDVRTMEALSSVVVQAVTQIETQLPPVSAIEGTHVIVSAQNGLAVDNANSTTRGSHEMEVQQERRWQLDHHQRGQRPGAR